MVSAKQRDKMPLRLDACIFPVLTFVGHLLDR